MSCEIRASVASSTSTSQSGLASAPVTHNHPAKTPPPHSALCHAIALLDHTPLPHSITPRATLSRLFLYRARLLSDKVFTAYLPLALGLGSLRCAASGGELAGEYPCKHLFSQPSPHHLRFVRLYATASKRAQPFGISVTRELGRYQLVAGGRRPHFLKRARLHHRSQLVRLFGPCSRRRF